MAPQLMAMNCRSARSLYWWIIRATSSLPVPLSPVINTVVLMGATLLTISSTCRMAGLLPTIVPLGRTDSSSLRRMRFSRARACFSSAFWIVFSKTARRKGFVMKSYAPSFMASTADSTVPYAVSITTSISGHCFLISRSSEWPLMPGIRRSVNTTSTGSSARISSAVVARSAVSTR